MLAMTPSSRKRGISAGAQVLGVLDAEAAVTCAVLASDALEDVEDGGVGTIADGVHHDMEACLVRPGDRRIELLRRRDEQTAV